MTRRTLVAALAALLSTACAPARDVEQAPPENPFVLPLGGEVDAPARLMLRQANDPCRMFRPPAFHAVILGPAHSCFEPPEVKQHWYEVGRRCEGLIRAHGQAINATWWPTCEEWLAR